MNTELKRIYFVPSEGTVVIDPETARRVPAEGMLVLDNKYYRRRVKEKAGKITDTPKEQTSNNKKGA